MKITLFIYIILISVCVFSQKSTKLNLNCESVKLYKTDSLHKYINISKVPKQYSFEFGYRYLFSIIDKSNSPFVNSAKHGYGFLFDYAWQLSGLNKKRPAVYLSVPIGYSVLLADNPTSQQISMLSYGWTIRHELSGSKLITPFLGYGLLLNTLRVEDVLGGVMGHQTQFETGVNLNTNTRLKYFVKIQYGYTSYPKMGAPERIHLQFADLRMGLRF